MEVITSKSNEKVKFIKSLNEKKFRQNYGAFYLEGIKVVKEVIQSNKAVDIMFIAFCDEILKNVNGGEDMLLQLEELSKVNDDIKILNISKEVFCMVTDTVTPQGILAVVKIPKYTLDEVLNTNSNILLLDRVQDLGNIGTIIRSADAFLVDTILCLNGTADVYSPKVVRSTMSSILREKIVYINEEDLKILKKYGHRIVGTSLQAKKYLDDFDFFSKSIFVLGNEANGMCKNIEDICDDLIKINMSSNAESLNVAVASGIILYKQYNK